MACATLSSSAACAFTILFASGVPVVEYYNTSLHHYFLTTHEDEMAAIDAGSAGPGWVRTGWSFNAYPIPLNGQCEGDCGVPVSRFYSAYSNSHFYTADPVEAQGLIDQHGEWMLERQEFSIPVPGASGACASGLTPVNRLYNNGFPQHDSNHRYVTDAGERARMVAMGWTDEGPRFCALQASLGAVKSFLVSIAMPSKILPSAQCEDETINRGPCMALNNLPTPSTTYPPTQPQFMPPAFYNKTGLNASFDYVLPPPSVDVSPNRVFVQGDSRPNPLMGIHVDTTVRGASLYSSVNPLYQFHSTADPGQFDDRFFPWGAYESPVELSVHFVLNVKTIVTREGSAAYGHPTLEFIDTASGHHVYFTVLAYGTVAAVDYLAPDVGTGKVIVGTTFRADSPYIRNVGLYTLPTPSGFVSPNDWGWGGYFEFRMNRTQFQQVLAAARTIDAALSSDPTQYIVDNFHFNNEVYGDGEIGLNLANYTVELVRP